MPSGPKKRKAAKKKKLKDSNNSNSSSTTHSHHDEISNTVTGNGESDGGELNSPMAQYQHNIQIPFVEVEKHEDGLSYSESLKVKSTEKDAKEEEGNIGIIDKRSKIEEKMPKVLELNKNSFLEETFVVNGSVNEPETLQYPHKQPLVASGRRAMKTTSWKGCCGILELLASSDS
ncbi:hypothetical protein L2E82_30755 [Cichorium intybus]|uniref:Uncharacterized protein n=1 Tax=Cichorium intybus TaxID=13427 RepID=A0ACB9D190_CICIN|nr:hypothetical protein L2E82_30755 [Cichorium intybus]